MAEEARVETTDTEYPTPPLPLRVAKGGRKNVNEEFGALLPTGIGERYSQTIPNLEHAALLFRREFPLVTTVLN